MKVGYARVSTRDQNLQMQIEALEAAGCERIFRETASGAQRERPELAKALDFMRPDDTLVVWKLDRLARSIKQLIETVEGLAERGIAFHSITEAIDTTGPSGQLVFHLFASLAQFERGLIRERTTAGLALAKSQGRVGGRPPGLTEADRKAAEALLADPAIPVKEVAGRLGISVSALYRHFPGGRSGAG
uniref:Site-specific DNA recombinase n=1 Tax=Candidatus Kentrum sp. FM TaxID=2126340 RepID=A0A450S6Y1_9GAMM|nr:MAG: Site-specific DNA recombinase [Candidatus Kentron sp. FM]VFJ47628.1 MAG: Site-specific DNA recombinase [Candidatus Kentron sp. FM]VFK07645.1 MAG: Site-specific DNA recombinase [Candidatus Kentron sp. FM]